VAYKSRRQHTADGVSTELAEYCLRLGRPLAAKRGDILARQGDTADRCFYVRSGYGKVTIIGPLVTREDLANLTGSSLDDSERLALVCGLANALAAPDLRRASTGPTNDDERE
jgi:hypothetical protein